MRRAYLTFAALGVSSLMATSAFAQGAVQREGTDAGGPANAVRAGETHKSMKSGKATRSSTTGSVRGGKAEKMGTDAGGPRMQGIPGQKQ